MGSEIDGSKTRGDLTRGRRLRSSERKEQIIDVALDLVAEYGVTGATINRIASNAGMTPPALYAHFANRKEILLAAVDVLIQKRTAFHRLASKGTALERLREIGLRHSEFVGSGDDKSVLALFEFIVAPPQEGLRDTLGDKMLLLMEEIAEVVRDGQKEGSILGDVDPLQVAGMIVSRAWTEDIAQLIGIATVWNQERSERMLDVILDSSAVSNGE
jgi:TetR/AcrR family transcriptional regulator, fatty acid metabolism regulator protein